MKYLLIYYLPSDDERITDDYHSDFSISEVNSYAEARELAIEHAARKIGAEWHLLRPPTIEERARIFDLNPTLLDHFDCPEGKGRIEGGLVVFDLNDDPELQQKIAEIAEQKEAERRARHAAHQKECDKHL